jgi:hypothetical protein
MRSGTKKGDHRYVVTAKEYLSLRIQQAYCASPSLRPFSNGDRAGALGFETATDFAKRKTEECLRILPAVPRKRGKGNQARPVSKEVHME